MPLSIRSSSRARPSSAPKISSSQRRRRTWRRSQTSQAGITDRLRRRRHRRRGPTTSIRVHRRARRPRRRCGRRSRAASCRRTSSGTRIRTSSTLSRRRIIRFILRRNRDGQGRHFRRRRSSRFRPTSTNPANLPSAEEAPFRRLDFLSTLCSEPKTSSSRFVMLEPFFVLGVHLPHVYT